MTDQQGPRSPAELAAETWRKMMIGGGAAAVALVVALVAFTGGDDEPVEPAPGFIDDSPPAAQPSDASARLACEHFRNVAGDVTAGILTGPELREKLQEVHETARVSENEGIASGAQAMLAGATSGEGFADAINEFGESCGRLGL
jgi:hypothetical protein